MSAIKEAIEKLKKHESTATEKIARARKEAAGLIDEYGRRSQTEYEAALAEAEALKQKKIDKGRREATRIVKDMAAETEDSLKSIDENAANRLPSAVDYLLESFVKEYGSESHK